MGTFIADGSSVLPAVKSDLRTPTGATTEVKADDLNQIRQALLDVRDQEITNAQDISSLALGTPSASSALVTATGSSTARSLAERAADVVNVKDYGATGDGSTDDTAALNAAAAAASASGRTFYLPPGYYRITGSVVFTATARILGAGMMRSVVYVDAAMGASTDALRLAPTVLNDYNGYLLEGFSIQPVSGTPGRHAIMFDVTGAGDSVQGAIIIRQVRTYELGGYALSFDSGNPSQGAWFGRVMDSRLAGGIDLNTKTADVWLVEHNYLSGKNAALRLDSMAGGSHVVLAFNDITSIGGAATVYGATQPKIIFNQIEQVAATTQPNNAVIDIIGSSYSVSKATIYGNNINTHGNALYGVRLDTCDLATIDENEIYVSGGTAAGVKTTANASNAVLGAGNKYDLISGAVALSDSSPSLYKTKQVVTKEASSGVTLFAAGTSGDIPVYLRGASGQTADLLLAQTSALGTLFRLMNTGAVVGYSTGNFIGGIQPGTDGGVYQTARIFMGSGAPNNSNGSNGEFYFRTDTPGTANQRLYVKSAGSWVGIL